MSTSDPSKPAEGRRPTADERKQATWLADLHPATARNLESFMRTERHVALERDLSLDDVFAAPGCHTGRFWAEWAACEKVPLDPTKKSADKYPRIDINFKTGVRAAPGEQLTPPSLTSQAGRLKALLESTQEGTPGAWAAFKQSGGSANWKLSCHYIAFTSKVAVESALGRVIEPISKLAEAGWDLSHLCDNSRCVRHSHMVVEPHERNMSRQRCEGVTLVTINKVIVHEEPCKHAYSDESGFDILTSCTRYKLLDLSDYPILSHADCTKLHAEEMAKRPPPPAGDYPPSKFARLSSG